MDPTVEWVKAVCAILGVASLPVLSWFLARSFERTKNDLAKMVQENLDRDRREAGQELEHLKVWLGEDLQRRLDAERAAAVKELEKMKAELARRPSNGAGDKRAEVASETLMTVLEYLDALRKTEWEYPKPDERDRGAGQEFRSEVRRRWEDVTSYEPALRRAMVQACVHLPEEVEDLIRKVARLKMRMSFKVQRWLRSSDGNLQALPADSAGMLLDVPWPRLGDEIRPLEDEARQLLRPIARHEAHG
jgi:hypothetical protein